MENKNDWNIDENKDDIIKSDEFIPQTENKLSSDVNPMTITTGNLQGPVVLFVGPQSCGKTTALIRLCKYLKNDKSATVDANRQWSGSPKYDATCDWFMDALHNNQYAPTGNNPVDFLCVDISKAGKLYCQVVEAPGEAYYPPKTISPHNFIVPPYIQRIVSSTTKKILVLTFFSGMLRQGDPQAYSNILSRMIGQLNPKQDKVIILYTRVDENRNVFTGGKPDVKTVANLLKSDQDYVGLFNALKDMKISPTFVPFSSGTFQDIETPDSGKIQVMVDSPKYYPESLYNAINRSIKGSWWS